MEGRRGESGHIAARPVAAAGREMKVKKSVNCAGTIMTDTVTSGIMNRNHSRVVIAAVLLLLFAGECRAQFTVFGRNKTQYNEFSWKVLRTEHFDIYYYDDFGVIASAGAEIAEEAFQEYQSLFFYTLQRRVPLIFYNTHLHFQQTNTSPGFIPEGVGGFFEFIKGRVVIPWNGSIKDFRHVIRHELAHVFMTNAVFRKLKERRLTTDRFPPLWFTEGFAEYLSAEMNEQGTMILRDAVLNGTFVPLRQIYSIQGSYLMYKEGQAFLEFVAAEFGKEKVMLLIDNIWMEEEFTKLLAYVLGVPLDEIDERWEAYMKKKYFPLYSSSVPFAGKAEAVTKEGFAMSPAVFRQGDSLYVYYIANIDGYTSVYRTVKAKSDRNYGTAELILAGERTEELEAFHFFQRSLAVSNSGILAAAVKAGKTDVLHFIDASRGTARSPFQSDDIISISEPSFSPNGSAVLFRGIDRKGFADIYLLDINTAEVTKLTEDFYDDRDPCFGVTAHEVIFSSDRTSGSNEQKYNLFSLDIRSGALRYIVPMDANCFSPRYEARKQKLYFQCDADSVLNLYSIRYDGSDAAGSVTRESNFLQGVLHPVLSGDTLYFAGFESQRMRVYSTPLRSGAPAQTISRRWQYPGRPWQLRGDSLLSERSLLRYEKEYELDYAVSQVTTDPVFGTRGGAVFSLSDMLGDDIFNFLIYNTAEVQDDFLKSFNLEISRYMLSKRTNYGYGIFHFSGRRYDIRESDDYFFERSFGSYFALLFPFSKFSRVETDIMVANSSKEIFYGFGERKALLWSNSVAYVFDNSLWASAGPIDGTRAKVLLGYTTDVRYNNVNYFTVIGDARKYFRLGSRSAIAARAALFYNEGKEARRYVLGGSWDLRGWDRWSIRGQKMWLASAELRFPLIDQIAIRLPIGNFGSFAVRGALFADAGSAWDREYGSTLGSLGGGFRFTFFNYIVFRYDIGKKIEGNFTRLQPGLFYQFFFGWDF